MRSQWNIVLVLIILAIQPSQTFAFYEQKNENFYIDARGLVRGFAHASQYPDDKMLYPDRRSSGIAGIARLMIDADVGNHWGFEINAYQTYIPNALATQQSSVGLPAFVERSAALETGFSHEDYIHLAMDRFALRWSNQYVNLTLGRQAINLATTFYFTPNDFFAPFSAQTFYRVYKSGVDAARVEISLGEFSQLSFISVLGYSAEVDSDTGWSDSPDSERDSHLVQWSNAYGNVETTLIAGRIVDKNIIGAALQGELFEWLGIRIEGHHGDLQDSSRNDYQQFNLGFEHRWENSFELRLELFYNGLGGDNIADYPMIAKMGNTQYLGRYYSALGGSYEITPLLSGQAVMISNFDDDSTLISLNTIYSLSDESELVINLGIPLGDKPVDGVFYSEFGSYPTSINMEVRLFF